MQDLVGDALQAGGNMQYGDHSPMQQLGISAGPAFQNCIGRHTASN